MRVNSQDTAYGMCFGRMDAADRSKGVLGEWMLLIEAEAFYDIRYD